MYWMQLQMSFRSMKTCKSTQAVQQTFSNIRNLVDKQSAQEIISAFEEKQQLSRVSLHRHLSNEENTGIQVYIGDEAPVKTMKDCSVVTATYELGEGVKGTIGIIGPKRMDYENVLKSNEDVSRVNWIRCFIKKE